MPARSSTNCALLTSLKRSASRSFIVETLINILVANRIVNPMLSELSLIY